MDRRIDDAEAPSSSRSDTEMNSPPSELEKMDHKDDDPYAAVIAEPLSKATIAEEEAVPTGMTALERKESAAEDYPQGLKLASILISIYCAVFLVALDRTIIATALPRITDDFHSFDDVGWVSFVPSLLHAMLCADH
jgi:hypothetical protein